MNKIICKNCGHKLCKMMVFMKQSSAAFYVHENNKLLLPHKECICGCRIPEVKK